jgi:hypothetical protein
MQEPALCRETSLLLRDFGQHWQLREQLEWLLGLARQLERERVLLGVSGHMILRATKPIGMNRT